MKVSSLSIVEELENLLLDFPNLVDRVQNKDPDFSMHLDRWMKEAEAVLKNNRLVECSEIAGLRSKIVSSYYADAGMGSKRKRQLQIAAGVLYDLQATLLRVHQRYEIKVSEARELLRQLLSIVKESGAIKYVIGSNFQDFVNGLWSLFSSHEQLRPSVVRILVLISQTDALRVIADEIVLSEWT